MKSHFITLSITAALLNGYALHAGLQDKDRELLKNNAPQTLEKIDHKQSLSFYDIKQMVDAKIPDDVIVEQIKETGSTYHLSKQDIVDLKTAGVSETVITAMKATPAEKK